MCCVERWSHHPSLTVALALTIESTPGQLNLLIGGFGRGREIPSGGTVGAMEDGGTSERYAPPCGPGAGLKVN
ncbi:hypothetical protein NPX13_g7713 [Xylaria arbuscula]|uniref:Uncharacterized protein n=1 Tax=Xylaria arbuscula TaxID=114810 RepID=A0A9W8TJ03_9PEZI|nr:hypothetical protein NPX13_g7713 [Xylaria arbuscula]